jgi:ribosomal protein S18 acetylase RimI-like enzyme
LEAAIKALPRSLYGVHIIIDGVVIGMGRIVGDGALNFEIVDIAVDPKYQKQEFGRVIMEHIMAYLDKEALQIIISRLWLMFLHYMKNLVLP